MSRHLPLILVLSIVAVVATGCDKNAGTPKRDQNPAPGTGTQPDKSAMEEAPQGIPPEIEAAVKRVWPTIEAAGAEVEAAFASAKTARAAGNPPSGADVQKSIDAMENFDKWAEIWNVYNDMVDDKKIGKSAQRKTERYLGTYERQVKGWVKKAKGIKELSTVK
ncbi:MAG: hypothetical protein ACYTGZ_22610 [Planctomycetota bacterium]|jgi:hypothetical protein